MPNDWLDHSSDMLVDIIGIDMLSVSIFNYVSCQHQGMLFTKVHVLLEYLSGFLHVYVIFWPLIFTIEIKLGY